MKNAIALFVAAFCLFLASCHRPVAYFQRTPHLAASQLPVKSPTAQTDPSVPDSVAVETPSMTVMASPGPVVVSLKNSPAQTTHTRVEQRMKRAQSLLPVSRQRTDEQPEPKPKKKLKLGNQIRQGLGMKLRPELNWWQRISWKLKASVLVILVAVVFAILHITILAIIFGILGGFLLISGLKKSFKVKRPWF